MSARVAAARPLKIGIICEGQKGCAETQVFPHLIKLICPEAVHEIVPSGNRPNVLTAAPTVARRLLDEGCVAVFVIWDVFPEWRDQGGTTDCQEHRNKLEDNLKAANMAGERVIPVAIHEELEAWLLCDAAPLMAVIGPLTRKKPIPHERNPDDVSNPKKVLEGLFKLGRGKRYNSSLSAGQIAAKLASINRLRRSQSFSRFEERLKKLCSHTT